MRHNQTSQNGPISGVFSRPKSTAVFVYSLILGIVFGHLGFSYDYNQNVELYRANVQNQVESEWADGLEAYFKLAQDGAQHARFWSELPLLQKVLSQPNDLVNEQLARALYRFAVVFGRYLEVYLVDPEGNEIMRFENLGGVVDPDFTSRLQDQSSSKHFKAARELSPGAIYVSRIETYDANSSLQPRDIPSFVTAMPVDLGATQPIRIGYFVLVTQVADLAVSMVRKLIPEIEHYEVIFSWGLPSAPAALHFKDDRWTYRESANAVNDDHDNIVFMVESSGLRSTLRDLEEAESVYLAHPDEGLKQLLPDTDSTPSILVSVIVNRAEWDSLVRQNVHADLFSRYVTIISRALVASLFLALGTIFYLNRVEHKRLNDQALQRQLNTDHLTGLLSRAAFEKSSRALLRAAAEAHQDTALCILDVDHFKAINDRYGHRTGDKVLVQLANILDREVGERDLVARWGGEEFVVILSNVSPQIAHRMAERFRHFVEGYRFTGIDNETLNVTVSIGVAMYLQDEVDVVFEMADKALYEAKAGGRNKVVFSTQDTASAEYTLES
jgi:diguanylate cyclase (GGDEF)-like protein